MTTGVVGLAGRWRVGGCRVSRIVEIESVGGSRFILPTASREAALSSEIEREAICRCL